MEACEGYGYTADLGTALLVLDVIVHVLLFLSVGVICRTFRISFTVVGEQSVARRFVFSTVSLMKKINDSDRSAIYWNTSRAINGVPTPTLTLI